MAAAIALVAVRVTELLEVAPATETLSEIEAVVVKVPVKNLDVEDAGVAELAVRAGAGISLYCGIRPPA